MRTEIAEMNGEQDRWIARLTPTPSTSIDALLRLPLPLDVWERPDDVLVVAATEAQLQDLERRNLAHVERLSTVDEFVARRMEAAEREEGDPE
jgi:hypothetical protein